MCLPLGRLQKSRRQALLYHSFGGYKARLSVKRDNGFLLRAESFDLPKDENIEPGNAQPREECEPLVCLQQHSILQAISSPLGRQQFLLTRD